MEPPVFGTSALSIAPDAPFSKSPYALLTPEPAEILHVPKPLLS
jgi:hypothetical protein